MRLIDADLFMQRIESYNTLDEMDKALYNSALHEIACMPTVCDIEQIRAEITELKSNKFFTEEVRNGLGMALDVFDQYRG